MLPIYNLSLWFYQLIIGIFSFIHPKAKLWIKGRKNWRKNYNYLEKANPKHPRIWIHAASLGEYEMVRPLMEGIKNNYPDYHLILSFFSPSGFENVRKDHFIQEKLYLPIDGKQNAADWFQIIQPKLIFMVKYELWHYYLEHARKLHIPCYWISARTYPGQKLRQFAPGFYKKMILSFDRIFANDPYSSQTFTQLGHPHTLLAGDPRFDRVLQIIREEKDNPLITNFLEEKNCWVLGSTWYKDEDLWVRYFRKNPSSLPSKLIVVPHEIGEDRSYLLCEKFKIFGKTTSLSQLEDKGKKLIPSDFKILIVDQIGILKYLYKYASLAYVGGGFNQGIHNILEPLAFQIPVIFGPNFHKFDHAKKIIELQIGAAVSNDIELLEATDLLKQTNKKNEISEFLNAHRGCTKLILEEIKVAL